MGLSLLSPWFLLGAVAVAVPIVLHLLARHTAPEVPFSATRFVSAAPVEQRRRRRITDWLLLALRALALLLLAFAFARPYVADPMALADAPARLVAVDTSFSMSAPETWAAASEAALEAVDAAPAGTLVGVASFDETARVVSPLSLDRGAARAAVGALRPGAAATDFRALASPASELLAGRPGELVLVSDLQRGGLRDTVPLPGGTSLVVAPVAPARTNLAVEQLSRSGSALVALVVNHGLEARAAVVTLGVDDEVIGRREVRLEAGASAHVRFDGAWRSHGVAVARLDDEGGLAADDERYLLLDEPPATSVWVVGEETDVLYAGKALAVTSRLARFEVRRVGWRDVRPGAGDRHAPRDPGGAADRPGDAGGAIGESANPDVVLVLSTRGMDAAARQALGQFVERGTGVLVAAGPNVDSAPLAQALGDGRGVVIGQADSAPLPTALVPADVRHAAFAAYADRASAYAGVRFDRIVRVRPAEGDVVLAEFANGLPALVERRVGRGRLMVLATDLAGAWNEWPLSPTFVPWLHETVAHLSARKAEPAEYLVSEAPAGVVAVPGAHALADGRRIVLNVDPRESSIDLATPAEVAAAVVEVDAPRASAAQRAAADEAAQSWWRVVVAVMLLALVVESVVGARRTATA